jgi:hypothetical protein
LAGPAVFKTAPINRSGIPPRGVPAFYEGPRVRLTGADLAPRRLGCGVRGIGAGDLGQRGQLVGVLLEVADQELVEDLVQRHDAACGMQPTRTPRSFIELLNKAAQ